MSKRTATTTAGLLRAVKSQSMVRQRVALLKKRRARAAVAARRVRTRMGRRRRRIGMRYLTKKRCRGRS